MPTIQDILAQLQAQSQPRPDLGAQQPVSTFAGRVVPRGEQLSSVMQRMPMGSGEGDLPTALQATLQALAQPAMQTGGTMLAKALVPKLLAMMVPAGRAYHGTGAVYPEFDPNMSRASGKVGPGVGYTTDNPTVAGGTGAPNAPGGYAAGATQLAKSAPTIEEAIAAGLQPNIRAYWGKEHNSFITDKPFPQADMDALIASIRQGLGGQVSSGGFQKGGAGAAANRTNNAIAAVKSQAGGLGQGVFDTLQNMFGPERTNQLIKNAGFQSITYPGGQTMGEIPHTARNVLDPTILQNLYEALAQGQAK